MGSKYMKPSWQVLVPAILVVSIISYLVSVNLLERFLYTVTVIGGDIVTSAPNYPAILLVVLVTLIISYAVAIYVQSIIHLKLAKIVLGAATLVMALLFIPDTVKDGILIVPFIITLCMFAISVLLLGQAFKKK